MSARSCRSVTTGTNSAADETGRSTGKSARKPAVAPGARKNRSAGDISTDGAGISGGVENIVSGPFVFTRRHQASSGPQYTDAQPYW